MLCRFIPLVLLFVLTGCTTTPEVLELSRATAVNAGLVARSLQRFAEDEQKFAVARTASMQALHDENAAARERFELDRLYTRETDEDGFEKIEQDLAEFIAKVDQTIADAQATRVEMKSPATIKVDERVKALAEFARSMAALAKQPSKTEKLQFMKAYIESVREYADNATEAE